MDFGFNDEQGAIKETAREMLANRSPLSKVREAAESRSYDDALWKEICDLGWPGIAISEEHGGQGLGMVELVILCEELGYSCTASPFLSNASAGLFVEHAGSDEQRGRWLGGIGGGGGAGGGGGGGGGVRAPQQPDRPGCRGRRGTRAERRGRRRCGGGGR